MRARLTVYGFLLWLGLALTWAAIRWWVLVRYYTTLKLPVAGDLRGMLIAAHAAFQHGWAWVYDPANLQPLTRAAGVGNFVMLNPPPLAVVLEVVGRVPWPAAAYLWLAVNAVLFAAAAAAVTEGVALSRRIALVAACFGFFPVFVALGQGNDTAFALFGLALGYRFERDGRPWAAGAALALVAFKPQMAFLLPVALAAAGRWRVLGAAVVAGIVELVLCVFVVGPGAVREWLLTLAQGRAHVDLIQSELNTAAYYLPRAALPVLIVVAAAAAAFVSWRLRRSPHAVEVAFATGILGSLLAAPYADPQEFSALLVAGWLLWRTWPRPAIAAVLVVLYAALTLSFLDLPSPVPWVEGAALLALVAVAAVPMRLPSAAARAPLTA